MRWWTPVGVTMVFGCGPGVVGEGSTTDSTGSEPTSPSAVSQSGGSDAADSGTFANDDASNDTTGAPTGAEVDTTTGDIDPEEAALGQWLCHEGPDAVYLSIVSIADAVPTGTACQAFDEAVLPPPRWTTCGEMVEHSNLGFDVYFLVHPVDPRTLRETTELEFGLSHVAATDTLEGWLFMGRPPPPIDVVCTRYGE